jgi:hypothetical protein
MPSIVGIIDEFADLMMASSSDLETPIARIAQMATCRWHPFNFSDTAAVA